MYRSLCHYLEWGWNIKFGDFDHPSPKQDANSKNVVVFSDKIGNYLCSLADIMLFLNKTVTQKVSWQAPIEGAMPAIIIYNKYS